MPARPKSVRVFAPTKVDHDLEIILEKPKDEVDGFDITVAPEFEGFGGKTINVDGVFEEGSNFKSVFVSDLIPAVSYDISVRSYVGSVFSKSMTQRGTVGKFCFLTIFYFYRNKYTMLNHFFLMIH